MEACLSVVIPAYNELATIDEVLMRVLAQPLTREVIVVDDGSTDGTRQRLADLADERIVTLFQPTNRGKGAALRRGFAAATSEFVVVQDADLEYDPADFEALLGPLLDGRADVVFGSRFLAGGAHRVLYYWHSVGNRLLTTCSNVATNLNLTDMETCYKAFRREVIQSIDLREDRFGFEPEITAKIAAGGWRVYEVGVSYHGRTYAEGKKIGWRDGLRALYVVAKYSPPAHSWRVRRNGHGRPASSPGDDELVLGETGWPCELAALIQPWLGQRVLMLGATTEVADALAQLHAAPVWINVEPSARTDTIVLAGALEHETDPAAWLTSLQARLNGPGRIVALVPKRGSTLRSGRRDKPCWAFDAALLRRLLTSAGLRPEVLHAVRVPASGEFLLCVATPTWPLNDGSNGARPDGEVVVLS